MHFVALSGLMVAVVSSPAYAGAKPKATPTPKATRDTPVWSPPSYDPNDYTEHIESYDVTLQVRRDGSMHVSEAIKYNFGDGPNPDLTASEHHGIIRKIPTHRQVDDRYDRVIQILHPHVRGEGIGPGDLQVSRSGDDEVLKIGNPDTTVSGVKTYVIDYDVHHALNPRNGGTDELYWDAIGTRWTVPISKATVTMTAPVGISSAGCYRGFEGDTSSCTDSAITGATLRAGDRGLSGGEGITLQVELPQTAMPAVVPPPLVRRAAPFAFTLAAAVLVLLALGIVAGFCWLCLAGTVRRRTNVTGATADSPPAGMSPGLAGLLRDNGSNRARLVGATLLDLATRGYIRFEEAKVSKRRISTKLVRGEGPADDLAPYEAKVIDVAIGRSDEVTLATLRRRGWDRWKAAYDLLEEEACHRGWFPWRIGVQRAFAAWVVAGLVVVGVVSLLSVSAGTVGGVPAAGFGWVSVAFLASAVVVGVIGRRPARTAAGVRATAEVNDYADTLSAWAKEPGDLEVDAALVSFIFPYAVAFGQADGAMSDWGKIFDLLEDELPWYVPAEDASDQAPRRISALADVVNEPPPPLPSPVRRGNGASPRRSGSYRTTYTTSSWTSSSSSGGWSSGGGFSGGGGGSGGGGDVGGGDGGGGGGSW
ncbi:DUF2207 domain-containing protein [Actinoallomurus sp. NBC_01490]|uniref:DUF2207 domain-containing protein n=1 Tax=Actinoallomurus sp. NBC_01490 TaxID=2903557 RepID=UPI002E2FC6A0|nr:DUF2207 domain-containing protein [Actinoallomurus sp. NBC_01490]